MSKIRQVLSFIVFFVISMRLMADPVNVNTAATVVANFWKTHPLTTDIGGTFRYTNIADSNGFSNFYIFEKTDGMGFVIVAADDRVQPVLAYSIQGVMSADIPENVKGWLRSCEDFISYCIKSRIQPTDEIKEEWCRLTTSSNPNLPGNSSAQKTLGLKSVPVGVYPLISTTWNQGDLYNNYCPYDSSSSQYTVVGCVATAMAQVMKYWEYPKQGIGTNSYSCGKYGTLSANFGTTEYDWDNMPNSLTGSCSAKQINAVALLSYHCGIAVNMEYGTASIGGSAASISGSGACSEKAFKNYFGYKSSLHAVSRLGCSDSLWEAILVNELNAARPVIYSGTDSSLAGHAFICDGYDALGYFHFNWGWGGSYDGYYALNNLHPSSGGIGSNSTLNFNYNNTVLVGIEPNKSTFRVIPSSLEVGYEGTYSNVSVRTTDSNAASWTVFGSQPWVYVSLDSGAGNGAISNIVVTTAPNYSDVPRRGQLTFVQGTDTIRLSILQSGENGDVSKSVGINQAQFISVFDTGKYLVMRPEAFGSYNVGDTITHVFFNNYYSSQYSAYSNMGFTIKIYENPIYTYYMSLGDAEYPSSVMGTMVYSQSYTAAIAGNQEVKLLTPYVITSKTFWIKLEFNGPSLIMGTEVLFPDTVALMDYPDPRGIKGYYLSGNSSSIRTIYNAKYADNTQTTVLQYEYLYNLGFLLSSYIPPLAYEIQAKPDDVKHGYVTGGGNYHKGDTVTLTAAPYKGYSFVQWQDGNKSKTRSFIVEDARYPEFVASFQPCKQVSFNLSSANVSMGSVIGGGVYCAGDTVTAVAVPLSGYQFMRWSDGGSINPRTFVIQHDTGFNAIFVASDSVYVHDTTIIRDTTILYKYVHDTTIVHDTTLVYCYIHDTTVMHDTAYIYRYIHDTTILHDTSYLYKYVHDTTIIVDTAYIYKYVYDTTFVYDTTYINNYIHDTTTVYDTIYINNYIHDTLWKDLNQYVFDIQPNNPQWGTTVGSGTYTENLTIGIAAIPNEGFRFVSWGDGSTENPRHLIVTDNVALSAIFESKDAVQNVQNTSLNVYPNPTYNSINFSMPAQRADIWDENGKCVLSAEEVSSLDLSNLANGVYTLRVISENEVFVKKIVKR